jgi:4-hydroxybenzoate polyprenyltransferase
MMRKSFNRMNNYLSMVKFSHTIFAMPFALIGFFIAVRLTEAKLNYVTFILVILCMIFARNAAMAFNRYADKEIDGKNPRTALREIPAGIIKARSALLFVIINVILFFIATYFINRLTFRLSPVAAFIILGYSFTKKFTSLSHLVLGLGLSLAPIGAYLAVTGSFNIIPVFFSLVVLFWVSGFDIIYSLQDEDFDKSLQLKSIPAVIGKKKAMWVSNIFHLLSAVFVILPGLIAHMGIYYWIGSAIFLILLTYQHLLVKPNDLSRINLAFFTTNGIASVIFALFTILDLYIG